MNCIVLKCLIAATVVSALPYMTMEEDKSAGMIPMVSETFESSEFAEAIESERNQLIPIVMLLDYTFF